MTQNAALAGAVIVMVICAFAALFITFGIGTISIILIVLSMAVVIVLLVYLFTALWG